MIIWIASYPKSGNTYIRSFLSAYYFSKDGEFDFNLLKNIKQFPERIFFNEKIRSVEEATKNYITAQKKICDAKEVKFLKTHSILGNYKGHPFTIPEYTLGAIQVVRDPRNVLVSLINHYSLNEKEAAEFITDDNRDIHRIDNDFSSYALLSSWSNHYKSWAHTKKYRKLIIKYEELKNNKYETFRDIVVFINTLLNKTERVNKKKLETAIKTTDFSVLKEKETKYGFHEGVSDYKGNKKKFFYKGFGNTWKNSISSELIKKIEKKFCDEMKTLGYLK